MCRTLATLCLLTAGLLGLAAERAQAGLRCMPASVDLGEIRGGMPRQHRFTLVNDGSTTIDIDDIERGCGCLETRLERRLLPPGAQTTLVVELRTTGQPNGPRSWNVRLRYRDGEQTREELLVLGGTIRNEVTVEPSLLALHVQHTLVQEVVITDRRSPPLQVTSLQASVPALHARIVSSTGGVTKVKLEVVAAELDKDRQEAVLNIGTDDPVYAVLQLPITVTRTAAAALIAAPALVQAHVTAEHPVSATLVRLRRADGQPLVVSAVAADDPGIVCTWAAGPGNASTLKVQVDRRRLAEPARPHQVRIQAGDHTLTIPIVIEP